MAITKIKARGIPDNTVVSAGVKDSDLINADFSCSANIDQSKIENLAPQISSLCSSLTNSNNELTSAKFNIGLLGFKMAVNESLTVFNLLDGMVDEFHDESGADEGEGSNDTYNATCDYYINSTQPDCL